MERKMGGHFHLTIQCRYTVAVTSTSAFLSSLERLLHSYYYFFPPPPVWTLSFPYVPSFSLDCCPPPPALQNDLQKICCLIGLYLNVNCNCSDTVCSFTDFSCNITLHSVPQNNTNCKKKRICFFLIMRFLVFVLIFATFVTSIFCEQHFKGEIVLSQQFSPDLV